ncbi:unnamed protein product, partial [Ixodes pacificus]
MSLFRLVKPTGSSRKLRSYHAPGRFRRHFLSDLGRGLIWAFLESGEPARAARGGRRASDEREARGTPPSPARAPENDSEKRPRTTQNAPDSWATPTSWSVRGVRGRQPRPPPRSALAAADHRALVSCAGSHPRRRIGQRRR